MYADVLLIENNLGDAALIREAVDRLPMPVVDLHLALDGHQALLILSNPHFQPGLIVLDLNIQRCPARSCLSYGRTVTRQWWF